MLNNMAYPELSHVLGGSSYPAFNSALCGSGLPKFHFSYWCFSNLGIPTPGLSVSHPVMPGSLVNK